MTERKDRLIRDKECEHLTGLKKAQRYKMESEGKFPLRMRISERLSAYSLFEVEQWVANTLESAPRIEYVTDERGRVRRTV